MSTKGGIDLNTFGDLNSGIGFNYQIVFVEVGTINVTRFMSPWGIQPNAILETSPFKMRCTTITYSNNTNNSDVGMEILINGLPVYIGQFLNSRTGCKNFSFATPAFTINTNEQISVKVMSVGGNNANTAIIGLYFKTELMPIGEFTQPALI